MTQQTQEAIEELELNIHVAKRMVDRGAALARLHSNRDFKEVFIDGYFNQEAVRLVHLRADPNMQDADSIKTIEKSMDGIGALLQYCRTTEHQAMLAEKAIEADEVARAELLQEGAE